MAAARVPSDGDTANADEFKDKLENANTRRVGRAVLRGETASFRTTALNSHRFGVRSNIMERKKGFLNRAKNPADIARTVGPYFASDL
jgi:hypothetical protein